MSNANVSTVFALIGAIVSVLGCDGAADRSPGEGVQRITQRPIPPPTRPGDSAAGGLGQLLPAGQPVGTTFFGVSAGEKASRIAYVVSSPGSMAPTFLYVQAELNRSINALQPDQTFTVIFYADDKATGLAIDGRTGLHPATDENKKASGAWVDKWIAQSFIGRPDPRPALEQAFKALGGPPDVIHFLTSWLPTDETAESLRKLNADKKVRVNAIMWVDRISEQRLQQIAREHGGIYTFISEEQLGTDY